MVQQEGTHGPDDHDRKAEGNSTSRTFLKGVAERFNGFFLGQH